MVKRHVPLRHQQRIREKKKARHVENERGTGNRKKNRSAGNNRRGKRCRLKDATRVDKRRRDLLMGWLVD